MEVLAIIPVRGGSKGIPGKNIKPLAGKPLVAYTIEAAHNSKYITRTVVSTESSKIKDVCLALGAEVIDRPEELARDETKTAPVLLQVAPFAGREGKFVTSRQLRERLFRETMKDVSLKVSEVEGSTDSFKIGV